MTTLQEISQEIRVRVGELEGSTTEKRVALMHDLKGTYQLAEFTQMFALATSPQASLQFVYKVNKSLGAVNEVLFNEFEIEPIHIKELKLATVDTLEEFLEEDIDTILTKIEE